MEHKLLQPKILKITRRTIITIAASFVGLLGIGLILLAYLEENPLKIKDKDITVDTYTLEENPPLELSELKKIDVQSSALNFGSAVSSNKLAIYPDKIYLNLKTKEYSYIAELNNKDELKILRSLSSVYQDIKLFDDNSIAAFTIRAAEFSQILWLNSANKTTELILSKGLSDELVTSYYFEPTQKIFYTTSYNSGGVFYINLILNNKSLYPFFETTLLDSSFEIIRIDISKNKIYLSGGSSTCKELNMESKDLKDINCNYINTAYIDFKVFIEGTSLFRIDNNFLKTKIIDLDSLYFYDKFYIKDNFVYFTKALRTNIETKSLQRINLDNFKEEEVIGSLPNVSINEIFILGNSIYLSTNGAFPEIYKYFSADLTPVSYTDNGITSYPNYQKPYLKTSFAKWYRVDLGFVVSEIEIMK